MDYILIIDAIKLFLATHHVTGDDHDYRVSDRWSVGYDCVGCPFHSANLTRMIGAHIDYSMTYHHVGFCEQHLMYRFCPVWQAMMENGAYISV